MTYYIIAVDHNEGTKENPVMHTNYIGIDNMTYYVTSYHLFSNAKQFKSIDEAKLFFEKNKEYILRANIWGKLNNPRIVEVKSTDCLSLI